MKLDLMQFETHCYNWLEKASHYNSGSLSDCFDRFTTLYIVFNRVYTEVGNLLRRDDELRAKIGPIQIPKQPFAPLPDRLSATKYLVSYYGKNKLRNELSDSPDCHSAIRHVVKLIETDRFYFHENYKTGEPDLERDRELAKMAKVHDPEAILSIIYQARCNMFHGSKKFHQVQRPLLNSLSTGHWRKPP